MELQNPYKMSMKKINKTDIKVIQKSHDAGLPVNICVLEVSGLTVLAHLLCYSKSN